MKEHLGGNGDRVKPSLTHEEVVYQDPETGEVTKNIVYKTVGEEFRLDEVLHGLSNSEVAINVGDYHSGDVSSRVLTFLDHGQSMVEFVFTRDGGATSVYHSGAGQLFAALTEAPMTLGSRPSRLDGGKLRAVAIQTSSYDSDVVTPGKEGKRNPFMVAAQIQLEHLNR